ncbi:copper amine oxidase-like protein [Fontibacillus phaseoli]|uniref:Copper amine oxidase-like protein n=1 Tax=Fontibacillus phaseoli TaxID=1416533 RepID=A0A369BIE7_9BACL|nr:copper amine oxidase N-terminal domain-containing protein [Fontibacillus phaseoli]RCX20348.1 copper amine oxidase-like protein [Fontibacillus phaseoli]
MKIIKTKWLALPLALLLVVLAGCQAVAGFDINKALLQSVKPVSSESSQTMSVEVVPAAGAISAEDKKIIDLINSFSLKVDSAKTQDASTASLKGTVGFDGKNLPFQLSMDEKGLVIQVEGAKQPIYISLDSAAAGLPDMAAYSEQSQQLSVQATEFLLKHLPNPSKISLKQVSDKVNGESVNLTNLQVEVRGDELVGLVKPFLTSVAKDEQGIKDLIGTFYDVFYPLLSSEMGGEFMDAEDVETLPESKAVTVAALTAAIQEELNKFLADYDKQVADLLAETPEISTVLSKDTVFKMDLGFDSKLNIRKQNLELSVALPASEDLPIQAVKVKVASEIWNVGGTVTADKVDTSAGVIDVMDGTLTPGQVLRNFEPGSVVYNLLKDEAQITHKSIFLDPYNEYYGVISKKNTSFVPLRYLSEQLDAEVKWTPGSKQIVIIDDITGAQITVSVGSKEASVNGNKVTLDQPVFVHQDGTMYVPLRFIAESLGATVTVDEEGWIAIERQ